VVAEPCEIAGLIDHGVVDRDAFDGFVKQHYRTIFNFILRMTGDFFQAADLTQDVFVYAYCSLPAFRGGSKVSTWLCGIATNAANNWLSTYHRHDLVGSLPADPDEDQATLREVPSDRTTPERLLTRRELETLVNDEIKNLPPDFRLVIVLRDLEGLTYFDIAQITGIPKGTVKSRLYRARACLRERLQSYMGGAGRDAETGGAKLMVVD